ncbi:MAG: hypothetical protein Q7T82_14525 [Armatimonadota bacterium]|nr:hypothetical protein [Armatimonadota bacterium]
MNIPSIISIAGLLAVMIGLAVEGAFAGQPGDFDAAPFGTPSVISAKGAQPVYAPQLADQNDGTAVDVPSGGSVQIEWRHPRDVYLVEALFEGHAPRPDDVTLQYWYHVWPDNGGGGWMRVDDPFNGRFVTAAVEADYSPYMLQFRLKPLEKTENEKIEKTGFDCRRTYKIRLRFAAPARVSELRCFTDSNWKSAEVKITHGNFAKEKWNGRFEARNARIVSASYPDKSTALVKLEYADNPDRLSPDRGRIVVREDASVFHDFSFFIDDVLRDGGIFVRNLDVFISDATGNVQFGAKPAGVWDATVTDTVSRMPEQTFERAMKEMPLKPPREAHLGLPNLRQEITVHANGELCVDWHSLRGPGQDRDRSTALERRGEWMQRRYAVAITEDPSDPLKRDEVTRALEQGYLPVIESQAQTGDIVFKQAVFATALDPHIVKAALALPRPPPAPMGKDKRAADFGLGAKGDETVVGFARIEIENRGKTEQTAYYWIKPTPMVPMRLDPDGFLILDAPTKDSAGKDLIPTWGQIDANGKGELVYLKNYAREGAEARDLIRYTVRLAPGEKRAIFLKVPYIEQMTPAEIARLKALEWSKSYRQVKGLWKKRLASALDQYEVPEKALMELYRANLWHVLMTTDRDVPTGLYEHGAATFGYPIYVNETVDVLRSLEMRGEYEEARRLFEPFIVSQGEKGLPGNFKSAEGLIYAAAPREHDHYTAQGYNMHHGFGLWTAAEHYFWTRDQDYLRAVAPNLIAACDWITRERKATMVMNPDGTKPIEYGLAPAGDLEDVAEYLYWYATNGYYYLGMKTAADALAEIRHPEAARIAADAKAYAEDIMTSLHESVATTPVVRLLDGTYIPYVPPRAYALTDLKEGWIREALYPSLHLVDCGLIGPRDTIAAWMLDDLEDRIYMSRESGYGLKDPKSEFFTFGGFTLQPNLLDSPIAYLERGQTAMFQRAFFNIYAASVYSDMRCFAEWVPNFGQGGGPLYKTPDECKFVQWMRQMLVMEVGNELHIGAGIPLEWMRDGKVVELKNAATYFGPMSLKITSSVAKGSIAAEMDLPTRNPAESVTVFLRHPEGKKMKSVTVNGKDWERFSAAEDDIDLSGVAGKVTVVAKY